MDNNVTLTDDELSLITTSLQMTIAGTEKYLSINGENSLDHVTMEAYREMKKLYERMVGEYF